MDYLSYVLSLPLPGITAGYEISKQSPGAYHDTSSVFTVVTWRVVLSFMKLVPRPNPNWIES